MNVKDIIEIEIQSSGMNGEGISRVDGKVVFVPYTLKGERVRAVVKQVKKNYVNASVIKILSPSEHRVTPKCPHYYKCGGCDMGHIDDEYRKDVLMSELIGNFKKIANLIVEPGEFVRSNGESPTRNKLSMPFGTVDGKTVLGLYRQDTHVVQPVVCGMSGKLSQKIAGVVTEFVGEKKLSVYNSETGKGLLRHLVVREIDGRASATLVINADGFDGEQALSDRLPDGVDFFVCKNTKRNNVIMGDSVRLIKGNERLSVNVLGVKAELSPLSFFQVNDYVRDELYKSAIDFVSSATLIDLYSGIGITSNLAAGKCDRVIAVEAVPQAVADADRTAAQNGYSDKIQNICGDVAKVLGEIAVKGGFDVLVDPPRKGCGADVMKAIAKMKPHNIIYISCNHATMCRDIRVFRDNADGYEITECKLFDMFPSTHHVETLCVLSEKR